MLAIKSPTIAPPVPKGVVGEYIDRCIISHGMFIIYTLVSNTHIKYRYQ